MSPQRRSTVDSCHHEAEEFLALVFLTEGSAEELVFGFL